MGAVSMVKLTLGVWDEQLTIAHRYCLFFLVPNFLTISFRVKYNSALYDDDDQDDDTQHENVIGLTAKSKSV